MLVLTRRVGESIVIANDVRITVVALGNGRVKIGIEAPQGISVDRAEIHERKLAEAAGGDALVVDSTTESGLHNRIAGVLPSANTARPELRKPR
jgi:carbon storage regulator